MTAVDYLKQNSGRDGVRELVIVRNGRMVRKGDDIDEVHGIWSCTKSFTSTTLGLLIEDGKCTLDTPAKKFAPEVAEHFPGVALRHFTTMTSGCVCLDRQRRTPDRRVRRGGRHRSLSRRRVATRRIRDDEEVTDAR